MRPEGRRGRSRRPSVCELQRPNRCVLRGRARKVVLLVPRSSRSRAPRTPHDDGQCSRRAHARASSTHRGGPTRRRTGDVSTAGRRGARAEMALGSRFRSDPAGNRPHYKPRSSVLLITDHRLRVAADLAASRRPARSRVVPGHLPTGRLAYTGGQALAQAGATERSFGRIEGRSAHDVWKWLRVGLDVVRRRDAAAHLGGTHHLDHPRRDLGFACARGTVAVAAEQCASDRRGAPCARRDHPRRISAGRTGARRTHLSTVLSGGSAGHTWSVQSHKSLLVPSAGCSATPRWVVASVTPVVQRRPRAAADATRKSELGRRSSHWLP